MNETARANGVRHAALLYPGAVTRISPRLHGVAGSESQILARVVGLGSQVCESAQD